MTTKRDVIRVHTEHPLWPCERIADALGCSTSYVRATAYRNALSVPGLSDGARGPSPSIYSLGSAARAAGLTIADIENIAQSRRVHAVAMRAEAE